MDSRRHGVPSLAACFAMIGTALGCGCSQIREDVGQPLVVNEAVLASVSSFHEALDRFGPPHGVARSRSAMVFLYEEIDLAETQLGVSLSTGDLALFKAVAARGTAERRLLVITFDALGRTRSARFDTYLQPAGRGAALQFLFAVAGIVDDDDLSLSPAAHDWGMQLLEADLPVALNRAQSMHTGRGGLEQRGTPTSVGQRTLELAQ